MVEASKNAVLLDNWIKTQASKHAYNEKTSGFIGKKCLKERVLSAVSREFIVMGHTREKVGLRLNEMLANDLTQTLIRDCDERRVKSSLASTGLTGTSLVSSCMSGASTSGVKTSGAGIGAATGLLNYHSLIGVGLGTNAQDNFSDKGKKLVTTKTEDEGEEKDGGDVHDGITFLAPDEPNQKFVLANPMSDVDRTIADFVETRLPNLPQARLRITSGPAMVDDPGDIFSRGGSSPQRSRSPESSIFISPPPPPALDPDIPSLPFKLQHRILITLQSILENACYDFARKHYPEFLLRKGWDCPEAGELTHWTRGLVAEFRDSPTRVVREADRFPLALKGIDEIRHSAVHRVPVSGKDIQRLIEKTKVVLHILDATRRMRDQIDEIDGIIERSIHAVLDKRRKKEEKLRLELEKLEQWKRILELREVRAIKQAEYEEENIQRSFRDEVVQALGALGAEERVAYSVDSDADQENSSDGDTKEVNRVQSESGAEESIPAHDEEYFHESEGWV